MSKTEPKKEGKKWYKQWWAIIFVWVPSVFILLIILLVILGSLIGEEETTEIEQGNSIETNPEESNAGEKELETLDIENVETEKVNVQSKNVYSVGETFEAGDFNWTILKVSRSQQVGTEVFGELIGERADGVFVILDVEIENTGRTAEYLLDSEVKLLDNQRREFSTSIASIYLGEEAFLFEEINPGIKKRGKLVFDVPPSLLEEGGLKIRIPTGLFSNEVYGIIN